MSRSGPGDFSVAVTMVRCIVGRNRRCSAVSAPASARRRGAAFTGSPAEPAHRGSHWSSSSDHQVKTMCGICGQYIFLGEAPVSRPAIEAMTDTIAHRGPDDEGYYIN